MVMNMREWTSFRQQIFSKATNTPYQFDGELNQELVSLARQENCSPNEIASRLLLFAIGESRKVQHRYTRWQELSAREQEVAAYVCQGQTNQEIALKLGISTETVKTHVRNVLVKFRLHKRHDLQMALKDCNFGSLQFSGR
jgi:DNA-binding CsgD family transcriptional regulator